MSCGLDHDGSEFDRLLLDQIADRWSILVLGAICAAGGALRCQRSAPTDRWHCAKDSHTRLAKGQPSYTQDESPVGNTWFRNEQRRDFQSVMRK